VSQAAFDFTPRRVQSPEVGLHHRDPKPTELAGALHIVGKSGSDKMRLLQALVNAGYRGLTDHEAAMLLELPVTSINGRRNQLVNQGWVEDSGRTRPGPVWDRRTKRFVPNIVWKATPRGTRASMSPHGSSRPAPSVKANPIPAKGGQLGSPSEVS
jgi:hypothetical protein